MRSKSALVWSAGEACSLAFLTLAASMSRFSKLIRLIWLCAIGLMLTLPFSCASTLKGCRARASWAKMTRPAKGRFKGRQALRVLLSNMSAWESD